MYFLHFSDYISISLKSDSFDKKYKELMKGQHLKQMEDSPGKVMRNRMIDVSKEHRRKAAIGTVLHKWSLQILWDHSLLL
ncbi:hypothetical protein ACH3XW_34445 [Acanthocheilonema viteae]